MPKKIDRIAFGSCNNHKTSTRIWETIAGSKPDIYIWTGDVIYPDPIIPGPVANSHKIEHMLSEMKEKPSYSRFRKAIPIIGTYDDHDYGKDNGGAEYSLKERSKELFLDFLDEPRISNRRNRNGIYTSYQIGEPGGLCKIIVLDTRFNRQKPGPEADILGEEQWLWLEEELMCNESEVVFIVSSTSVISNGRGYESWSHFPSSRKKLYGLLNRYTSQGVIFITGDKHYAELTVSEDIIPGVPIAEILSSGLTHSYSSGPNNNGHNSSQLFFGINYGLITIEWNEVPVVNLEIRNKHGWTVLSNQIIIGQKKELVDNYIKVIEY